MESSDNKAILLQEKKLFVADFGIEHYITLNVQLLHNFYCITFNCIWENWNQFVHKIRCCTIKSFCPYINICTVHTRTVITGHPNPLGSGRCSARVKRIDRIISRLISQVACHSSVGPDPCRCHIDARLLNVREARIRTICVYNWSREVKAALNNEQQLWITTKQQSSNTLWQS